MYAYLLAHQNYNVPDNHIRILSLGVGESEYVFNEADGISETAMSDEGKYK